MGHLRELETSLDICGMEKDPNCMGGGRGGVGGAFAQFRV